MRPPPSPERATGPATEVSRERPGIAAPPPAPSMPKPPVIERVVERMPPRAEPQASPRPHIAPRPPLPPAPAAAPEETRIHEVLNLRRPPSEGPSQRAEPVAAPPRAPAAAPAVRAAAPRDRRPGPPVAPLVSPPPEAALRGLAPDPRERDAAQRTAPEAPHVHVSIARIVVRVPGPPEAPRSAPVRPAAPAVSLEAYTAARRGGDRGGSR
ncbi:MAG: hypothetical protein R3F14_01850 [Polyangiaceae bacterium]